METSPAADTVWDDIFGGYANDYGYAVQETDDGYILAASTSNFGAGNFDAWLVRIDYEYEILWHQTFGGSGSDNAYDVQMTSDGGFIGAGSTSSFGPGDKSYFLFKSSGGGDSLWANVFGGEDKDECRSVKQTSDGGFIMAGYTKSFGAGNFDWYIVRTDANGDSLWTKVLGGAQADECFSVQLTTDGGYIIAGSTRSFGAGNSDIWLIKLAPDVVGINENPDLRDNQMLQIFPNPLSTSTKLKYELLQSGEVRLAIYNHLGQQIETLVREYQSQGRHQVTWNAEGLPAGIYFFRLQAGEQCAAGKMVVLR